MQLEIGTKTYPRTAQRLSFDAKSFAYTQPYLALHQNYGSGPETGDIQINLEDFKGGYGIFTFNLTPDSDSSKLHKSMPASGVIKLLAEFKAKLDKPLLFLFIMQMERVIEIDRHLNVEVI